MSRSQHLPEITARSLFQNPEPRSPGRPEPAPSWAEETALSLPNGPGRADGDVRPSIRTGMAFVAIALVVAGLVPRSVAATNLIHVTTTLSWRVIKSAGILP